MGFEFKQFISNACALLDSSILGITSWQRDISVPVFLFRLYKADVLVDMIVNV